VNDSDRVARWLLGVSMAFAIAGCSRDTSDAGPRAAAAVAAIALQSDEFKAQRAARELPVELDYQLRGPGLDGRPATLELVLRTPLVAGVLEVTVDGPPGLILPGVAQHRFDLATAPRPLLVTLELGPVAGRLAAQRALTIRAAARAGRERRTRSFHIVLPAPADPS
jgi:hypothetical protein